VKPLRVSQEQENAPDEEKEAEENQENQNQERTI
jgi:hypothetical protein